MRRRRALHLAGSLLATSLAGCTALGDALTGPHHYERDAPVDGGPAGPWPTLGHDARRSGYAPAASGPPADAGVTAVVDAGRYPEMQPAFADETLYYGVDRRETDESGSGDTFSGFVASDLDGTERWTVAESQGLATPTVVGNTVFTTSAGETRALDRRDGSRCWQYDVGTGIPEASPTVVGETVYATGGEVAALDARTGERRWTAMTGTRGLHGTAATDSLVAVASGNGDKGGAYGLAPEDGAVLWDAPIPRASYTPPVIGDGRVFVVTTDGTLHALGSADGSVLWRYSLDGSSYERVAVSEGTVYVKGTNDTRLFALDARDGTERWSFELGTWGRSAPAVAGGVVYVAAGIDTGVVYALNTSTGEPTTRFDLPSAPQAGPVVGDGVAVVTTGRLSTEEGHLVLS